MRWLRRRSAGQDLSCREAVALVTAYLDDALAPADRRRFEAHVKDCEMCSEHIAQIKVTIAAAGRIGVEDLDPLARDDLIGLYRRWRDEPVH